ncbi:MAG TPA: NAD(P)/FAD-dependent oxidoreductase [Ignavibacteria bacterium]|nr:NAD(P)/FAD-dependent oxidoreductase [Ignavibacteria bacterium]HRF65619.1 NAD(P)/FAD-dependent oxidoreductase [Ignavibacteria bacterium]HRJ03349.1 NAD(P)/FAD-dependent oxidoreductase [Ignavibacteria bacterium]
MLYNTIIIGAGAAGLMCAIEAGKRGRKVLVLEHAEKIGKKILISGGGRCNFTNLDVKPENYISNNPHFCKSALARYTPQDFISLVEKHGIKYHEKKLGQLFGDGSAKEIVQMLQKECDEAGVEIKVNCTIDKIERIINSGSETSFRVTSSLGEFPSETLVIATGGISIPQMGATDFGYKVAKQHKIKLIKAYPGLVPFVLKDNPFAQISGVSLEVKVSCNNISFIENILFTHRGLSGPVILQISSYWNKNDDLKIDLLPEKNILSILIENRTNKVELVNFLSQFFPKRFSEIWCETFFYSKPVNQLNEKEIQIISKRLHNLIITPFGTEGFGKAEVTKGGVDTNELSSKTMESRKVSGLYFIGEVVDVTGWLGGYNFQWAWASGFAAGQYA